MQLIEILNLICSVLNLINPSKCIGTKFEMLQNGRKSARMITSIQQLEQNKKTSLSEKHFRYEEICLAYCSIVLMITPFYFRRALLPIVFENKLTQISDACLLNYSIPVEDLPLNVYFFSLQLNDVTVVWQTRLSNPRPNGGYEKKKTNVRSHIDRFPITKIHYPSL